MPEMHPDVAIDLGISVAVSVLGSVLEDVGIGLAVGATKGAEETVGNPQPAADPTPAVTTAMANRNSMLLEAFAAAAMPSAMDWAKDDASGLFEVTMLETKEAADAREGASTTA